jgi:hypothetical protein
LPIPIPGTFLKRSKEDQDNDHWWWSIKQPMPRNKTSDETEAFVYGCLIALIAVEVVMVVAALLLL